MPVQYINRKKEPHYLRAAITKKGGKRYYVIKDLTKVAAKDLLDAVPEGFEFYEQPMDAKVVLRKKMVTIINDEERRIIQAAMQKHQPAIDYIIDIEASAVAVHTGQMDIRDFPETEDKFHLYQWYIEKLRFEKSDGSYKAQRWCHIPGYDTWITMETGNDLAYLADKYCYYADKESLLDF